MFRNSLPPMRLGLLVSFILLATIAVFGQSQANTGNIDGRVSDPNGAGIPNVTVTATNEATSISKTSQTKEDGTYRIAGVFEDQFV